MKHIRFKVIVFKEEDTWIAAALEKDCVYSAPSKDAVIRELTTKLIIDWMTSSQKQWDELAKGPKYVWDLWKKSVHHGYNRAGGGLGKRQAQFSFHFKVIE